MPYANIEDQRAANRRYAASAKGRAVVAAAVARYRETEKGKEAQRRSARSQYERNTDKCKARIAVSAAVRDGRLRPQPCWICGRKGQAHHPSYAPDMRLAVSWLCATHHREIHDGA